MAAKQLAITRRDSCRGICWTAWSWPLDVQPVKMPSEMIVATTTLWCSRLQEYHGQLWSCIALGTWSAYLCQCLCSDAEVRAGAGCVAKSITAWQHVLEELQAARQTDMTMF